MAEGSPIPDIRSSPGDWYKYFDIQNANSLRKGDVLQALVDTINATTGSLPDIELLMESVETMWSACGLSEDEDGTVSLDQFKTEGGLGELIAASGLLPFISPGAGAGSGSYNDNMSAGSGVGSGYNYDYDPPRGMRVIWYAFPQYHTI